MILPLALSGGVASASPGVGGTIKHWGAYFGGPVLPLPYDLHRSPVRLNLPGRITEIATSNSTQYALLANGSVYAWGLGNTGQLGDGSTESSFTRPVRVRFPAGVKIASVPIDVMPFNTGLALDTTGHVWGWGYNSFAQLCLGNRTEYNTPVRLPLRHVTLLSGAGGHSLFYSRGKVYACGNNTYGELGNGSRRSSKVPVQVTGLGTGQVTSLVSAFANWRRRTSRPRYRSSRRRGVRYRLLATSGATSYAVSTNGNVYAWGANVVGQVGNGGIRNARYPVRVASRATSISATAADVMISVRPRSCDSVGWTC